MAQKKPRPNGARRKGGISNVFSRKDDEVSHRHFASSLIWVKNPTFPLPTVVPVFHPDLPLEEALKMHFEEVDHRNILGTMTDGEEKELQEEGVEYVKVPVRKLSS